MNRLGLIAIASIMLLSPFLFNDVFGESQVIVKAVDESITNDNALQDDDELFFTCDANTVYAFDLSVFFTTSAGADYANAWTLPSGTGNWTTGTLGGSSSSQTQDVTTRFEHNAGTALEQFQYKGIIEVGVTGGTCNYQFSQRNVDGGNTITEAGSALQVWEQGTTLTTGQQGEQGIQGVAGSAGRDGKDGSSPVQNPVSDPTPITQTSMVVAEPTGVFESVGEFFEFAVVNTNHDQLIQNSFLNDQRLGIRWSSGMDLTITQVVPASSPFLITFEQLPSVKQGSGAVVSTDFILYNLQVPDDIGNARYEVPVTVTGQFGDTVVQDVGTITVDLTEEPIDPILLLLMALIGIPVIAGIFQSRRGRSPVPSRGVFS